MANTKKIEASIEAESNKNVASAERERKLLAQCFKKQEPISVSIPPLYKPYFGKIMTVTIQGVSIAIPVDGRSYKIPESFAEEVKIRISNQNELFEKHNSMSDITGNFESSAGELQLF